MKKVMFIFYVFVILVANNVFSQSDFDVTPSFPLGDIYPNDELTVTVVCTTYHENSIGYAASIYQHQNSAPFMSTPSPSTFILGGYGSTRGNHSYRVYTHLIFIMGMDLFM